MADTMKALVYHGPGVVEIEERLVPKPGRGEVQIRVKRCSICGSDLGAYRFASDRFAPPLVLGHEFSGDISALGEGVEGLCVGQKVTVNPMVVCRECNESFQMVRNGGTVVLVALMHEDVNIDPMEIVGRGLNFIGSYMFTSEMIEAAQMLADKKLEVEDLITSSYPLEQGKQALDVLDNPHNSEIKVQLTL